MHSDDVVKRLGVNPEVLAKADESVVKKLFDEDIQSKLLQATRVRMMLGSNCS